jgi:hypothetical protein
VQLFDCLTDWQIIGDSHDSRHRLKNRGMLSIGRDIGVS